MDDILFGLRIASDEVRNMLYEKQKEVGISNESMCIILRDIIGEFEAKRSGDYAKAILGLVQQVKGGGVQNGSAEDTTVSGTERGS